MFKNGEEVLVICGKDKGKKGKIIEILRSKNKAKVQGINMIKKHEKTTKEKKGGIITKENFMDVSNLKLSGEAKKNEVPKKKHQEIKNNAS
jgi:large subunit ribosomal protein L24